MPNEATMATKEEAALMRPPRVLIPLINEEVKAGERAGLEHYRVAGEMLLEAKAQLEHGAWKKWFQKNIRWSWSHAQRYMTLARLPEAKIPPAGSTLSEAVGDVRRTHDHAWVAPVREVTERVNTDGLAEERQSRAKEAQLLHALGHQLIDIGYKVLAAKLHPDKPEGSTEAMTRLNKVRTILRGAI